MSEPQRFFFVHLQKTAGTSLARRLKQQFDKAEYYPNSTDGDPISRIVEIDHLARRWRARGDQIRIIVGHFPLCATEILGADFHTFTVLREPVERTLSYLRHHRKLTEADRHLSLEQIYDDPFRFNGLIHNHMVKMFSLAPEEADDGVLTHVEFTPERLERAKRRLTGVDVVGTQDRFEDFCLALSARFGWDLGDPVHINRTEPEKVSSEFRRRIEIDNAMDIELYEFARQLVAQRSASRS